MYVLVLTGKFTNLSRSRQKRDRLSNTVLKIILSTVLLTRILSIPDIFLRIFIQIFFQRIHSTFHNFENGIYCIDEKTFHDIGFRQATKVRTANRIRILNTGF